MAEKRQNTDYGSEGSEPEAKRARSEESDKNSSTDTQSGHLDSGLDDQRKPSLKLQSVTPQDVAIRPRPQSSIPIPRYVMCRHYERTKHCSVGAECKFAHGDAELRSWNSQIGVNMLGPTLSTLEEIRPPPPQASLMKLPQSFSLCSHYTRSGHCHTGKACKFAHGIEEINSWNQMTGRPMMTEEQLSRQMKLNEAREQSSKMKSQGQGFPGFPGIDPQTGYSGIFMNGVPAIRTPPEGVTATFRLCDHQLKGRCSLGVTCKFAHSEAELQYWRSAQTEKKLGTPYLVRPMPYAVLAGQIQMSMCPNMQLGSCPNADSCPYAHSVLEFQSWQVQQQQQQSVLAVMAQQAQQLQAQFHASQPAPQQLSQQLPPHLQAQQQAQQSQYQLYQAQVPGQSNNSGQQGQQGQQQQTQQLQEQQQQQLLQQYLQSQYAQPGMVYYQ